LKKIVLQQTLHGYTDGHRLIEASKPLAPEADRLLLVLSDISGPSTGFEFQRYLTGYPLDHNTYAFACTWRAWEMPRPGCVWTHTFLIDAQTLGELADVAALTQFFRRPGDQEHAYYRIPLEVDAEILAPNSVSTPLVTPNVAKHVLAALYGHRVSKTVRLVTDAASRYEDFVLAIWMQQWPKMRRSFTFCTLALDNRTLSSKPFALQVMPRRAARSRTPDDVVVDVDNPGEMAPSTSWVDVAVRDLLQASQPAGFRDFIRQFGGDIEDDRMGFRVLADVYSRLHVMLFSTQEAAAHELRDDAQHLVKLISSAFPEPKAAARLKMALFGLRTESNNWQRWRLGEGDLLFALATTPDHKAFYADVLAIASRTSHLVQNSPQEARGIGLALIGHPLTPLGITCLETILDQLDQDDIRQFVTMNTAKLLDSIRQAPELAASSRMWAVADEGIQRELWKSLVAGRKTKGLEWSVEREIVQALLTARADNRAQDVVSLFGDVAVSTALDRLNSAADGESAVDTVLSAAWRRAIALKPAVIVQWLSARGHVDAKPWTLSVLGTALDPDAAEVSQVGMATWVKLAERATGIEPCPVEFLAFLLALGFRTNDSQAAAIPALTFEMVHDAAGDGRLNEEAWGMLERVLPPIWDKWDRCERLRRGLAEAFLKRAWPTERLLQASKRARTFELIVEYCWESSGQGREMVRRLAQIASERPAEASEEQRAILSQYATRRWWF